MTSRSDPKVSAPETKCSRICVFICGMRQFVDRHIFAINELYSSARGTMRFIVKTGLSAKRRVAFNCPRCAAPLESPLEEAGSQFPCPTCGQDFTVPGIEELKRLRAE